MPHTRDIESWSDPMIETVNEAIGILTLGVAGGSPAKPTRPRYQRIVVAYDGSPGAVHALNHARDIAKLHGSRVVVASVYTLPDVNDVGKGISWYSTYVDEYSRVQNKIRASAEKAVDDLKAAKIDAGSVIEAGGAAREIAKIATKHEADLIVTGATRRGPMGRLFLGSTPTEILERSTCSVLIARTPPRSPHILVATDGSHVSYRAVAHALRRASETQAELTVQHVINYPEVPEDVPTDGFLQAVMAHIKLPAAPPKVRYVLDAGDPATRILERAKAEDCGLIVLGAHGKGMVERALVGSVSRRVVRETDASVLVVKAP